MESLLERHMKTHMAKHVEFLEKAVDTLTKRNKDLEGTVQSLKDQLAASGGPARGGGGPAKPAAPVHVPSAR